MGYGTYNPVDFTTYKSRTASKSRHDIFTSHGLQDSLNPLKFGVRESRNSKAHPKATPIAIFSDVTGSMGHLAEIIVKKDFGLILEEVINRKPFPDPHLLVGAIGDCTIDSAPIQYSQFETDMTIARQIEQIFIEGGGGGNAGESYHTAWYAMGFRTMCDAFVEGRKGFLFTIGDEPPLDILYAAHISRFFGDKIQGDLKNKDLLETISQDWEVFHLIVGDPVRDAIPRWKALLGERAMVVRDHTKLGEIIVSTTQIISGEDAVAVASSWSGDTSLIVKEATRHLTKGGTSPSVRL